VDYNNDPTTTLADIWHVLDLAETNIRKRLAEQEVHRPQILVVGTYHMSNPDRDLADVKADDVLLPKRQDEMAELISILRQFAPTKIAIEAEYGSKRVSKEYSDYLAGEYTLTRNETNQIGYRLAKELGQKQIYPVDVMEDFPWQHVVNWAKANGMATVPDTLMAQATERAKRQSEFLGSHTILQTLEYMNSPQEVAADVGSYYSMAQLGDPDDEAGPELLARWFKRNIEIYNIVHKLIDSGNERVLVIYGAGHLGWLRQDITNDPSVQLRTLDEFIAKP
jgi:hypothetical protein